MSINRTINFANKLSLNQAANLIRVVPENRHLLVGEPGIGKSTLIKALASKLPTHEVAYIDVPNMDLGDIAMPVIDHETKTTRYYPNARFKMHTGKPVIIMLDEYTKGAQPIKNMLEALLEAVRNKPLLGVCVGERMLFDNSEEGNTDCLGLMPGKVVRFDLEGQKQPDGSRYKVPQMGWNRVRQVRPHPMWADVADHPPVS